MTSTRCKVKIKVTELLKFRKLDFSRSISSAVLAWSSKLMLIMIVFDLDYRLSEPDVWISFLLSYHVTSDFAECRYYRTFKGPYFCIVRGKSQHGRVCWYSYMYCACWRDLDTIQGQGHAAVTVSTLLGPLFQNRTSWVSGTSCLWTTCLFCHPGNSIKALKGTRLGNAVALGKTFLTYASCCSRNNIWWICWPSFILERPLKGFC